MPRTLWDIDFIEDKELTAAFSGAVNREIEKALNSYIGDGQFFSYRHYNNYRVVYHLDDDFDFKSTTSLKKILIECAEDDEEDAGRGPGIAKKLLSIYLEWERSYSGEKDPNPDAD